MLQNESQKVIPFNGKYQTEKQERRITRHNLHLSIKSEITQSLSSYGSLDQVSGILRRGLKIFGVYVTMTDMEGRYTSLIGHSSIFPKIFNDFFKSTKTDLKKDRLTRIKFYSLKKRHIYSIDETLDITPQNNPIWQKIRKYLKNRSITKKNQILVVPLKGSLSQNIGVIFLVKMGEGHFQNDELQMIDEVASSVALSIFHRRNEEYLTISQKLQDARAAYITELSTMDTGKDVIRKFIKFIQEKYHFEHTSIWRFDKETFNYLQEYNSNKHFLKKFIKTFLYGKAVSASLWQQSNLYKFIRNKNKIFRYFESFSELFKNIDDPKIKKIRILGERIRQGRIIILCKISEKIIAFGFISHEIHEAVRKTLIFVLEITASRLKAIEASESLKATALFEKERADFQNRLNNCLDEDSVLEVCLKFFRRTYSLEEMTISYLISGRFQYAKHLRTNRNKLEKKIVEYFLHHAYLPIEDNKNSTVQFYKNPQRKWLISSKTSNLMQGVHFSEKDNRAEDYIKQKIVPFLNKKYSGVVYYKLSKLGFLAAALTRSLTPSELNSMGVILNSVANRIRFIRSNLELQIFKGQEIRTESLERTSWAIGHKLNNLLLQTENAYLMGKDISAMFKEFSVQTRGLMEQTQSREVPPKFINLNEFTRNISDINFYKQRNLKVSYFFSKEIPYVFIRTAVLRDILINLIRNAMTHGKAGTIKIHTGIINKSEDQMVRLEVWDDGIGVPNEVLLKGIGVAGNTSSQGGTGMGLHQIIQDLKEIGGHLSYRRDGPISKFIINMPVSKQIDSTKEMPALLPYEVKKVKILLVDDEQRNLSIYQEVYQSIGFFERNILLANNVKSAFKLFTKHKKFLVFVLCDMYMNNETGIDLFTMIREVDKDIYFCFISGNPELQEIRNAKRAFPSKTAFLQKGADGLSGFEHFAIRAIRKHAIPAVNLKQGTPKLSTDMLSVFVDGLRHRLNNLIIFPMAVSEMGINFGSVDYKMKTQTENTDFPVGSPIIPVKSPINIFTS